MGTLSASGGKPRQEHWKGPGHCRWCGDKLRPESQGDKHGGYRDNGEFCSLRCGFQQAVLTVAGIIYRE